MESKHLWVLITLLVGLWVLYMLGSFGCAKEGFQTGGPSAGPSARPPRPEQRIKSSVPRCPPLYTFFNDETGASFCCRGQVNPYTHTCGSRVDDDLCAFVADTPDPRNPSRKLRLCSEVVGDVFESGSAEECPSNLPHYSTDGVIARCCKTGTTADGATCVAADLAAEDENNKKTDYCVAKGEVTGNEKRCSELKMVENVQCPTGFQGVRYVLREREATKYGNQVQGVTIPTCYRVNESCIPDSALDMVSKEYGAFVDRGTPNSDGTTDWSTWKWSCSGLNKLNRGLVQEVTKQLYP